MLQSKGSQRVRQNLVTEQHNKILKKKKKKEQVILIFPFSGTLPGYHILDTNQ